MASVADFAASVRARVVPGETAALDFPFWMHSTALGHWLEAVLPLFRSGWQAPSPPLAGPAWASHHSGPAL